MGSHNRPGIEDDIDSVRYNISFEGWSACCKDIQNIVSSIPFLILDKFNKSKKKKKIQFKRLVDRLKSFASKRSLGPDVR